MNTPLHVTTHADAMSFAILQSVLHLRNYDALDTRLRCPESVQVPVQNNAGLRVR